MIACKGYILECMTISIIRYKLVKKKHFLFFYFNKMFKGRALMLSGEELCDFLKVLGRSLHK